MKHPRCLLASIILIIAAALRAQPVDFPDAPPGPGFGPGGPPFGGPGPMQQELKLIPKFDKDGDKRLNAAERKAARAFVAQQRSSTRGRRGPRRPPGTENDAPPRPGPKMKPQDVNTFAGAPLFASNVVRTLFLDFENADWEKELSDFHNTDVDVPAKLTVDGRSYSDVGVHFRGASSYMMVPEGRKRSLNVSLDHFHKDQNLLGFRTLNLLNSHEDPSFLRTVLYAQIARDYIAAPRANFVRVVINGEYWGVFVNSEQFNKDFLEANYGSTKGARWKVSGSPRGAGSLAYLGEEAAPYKKIYEMKSKDDRKAWADLIRLCKTLNQTPSSELAKALEPQLDIDETLKFLALENALINNDGYWIRTSDYNLFEDDKGRFHVIPHDANETFARPGGPGFGGPGGRRPNRDENAAGPGERSPGAPDERARGGGPQINGLELDPLIAATDSRKPLISKLLAVPELKARYLGYVHDIAERWLDWNKLGSIASNYHALIAGDVKLDTRKLDSTDAFEKSLTEDLAGRGFGPGGGGTISLKNFADQRRAYLLRVTDRNKS